MFRTDDVKSQSGVVEVGAYPHDLAFHPVLAIGVAEQVGAITPQGSLGKALHVFNSKSLAKIRTIPLGSSGPPGPALLEPSDGRLLTFAAKGTKLLYYDKGDSSALRSIPLLLSEQDKAALEKAYSN